MMLGQLDALVKAYPAVRMTIHVDEVSHSVTGVGDADVTRRSLEFDEALRDAFERGMGLPFARHTTCVLSTSSALAVRVASQQR